jgi:hypothetical protein
MTSEEISSILIPDFETPFGEQEKVLIKIKQTPIENQNADQYPKISL